MYLRESRNLAYIGRASHRVGGRVVALQRRQPRRRRGQLEGDALSAEAADAQQDAAEDGEQEV